MFFMPNGAPFLSEKTLNTGLSLNIVGLIFIITIKGMVKEA